MVVWHNPKCSKSRACIESLNDKNISYTIREYLQNSPSKKEIMELINLLDIEDPRQMMRTKEDEYKELNLSNKNMDELIDAMVKIPKLIERPIAINNGKAAIGRPLENIINII